MSALRLAAHLPAAGIKERLKAEKEVRFYKYWQILNAVVTHTGIKAQEIIAGHLSQHSTPQ